MFFNNDMYENMGDEGTLINIHKETNSNPYFRKEMWTGEHLQLTVMSIPVGGEIGLEVHDSLDQFIRVEYGMGAVYMGKSRQGVKFVGNVNSDYAILIPAGTWHNIINTQSVPLKVYSLYAPPKHPKGTIHKTKFESDLEED